MGLLAITQPVRVRRGPPENHKEGSVCSSWRNSKQLSLRVSVQTDCPGTPAVLLSPAAWRQFSQFLQSSPVAGQNKIYRKEMHLLMVKSPASRDGKKSTSSSKLLQFDIPTILKIFRKEKNPPNRQFRGPSGPWHGVSEAGLHLGQGQSTPTIKQGGISQ